MRWLALWLHRREQAEIARKLEVWAEETEKHNGEERRLKAGKAWAKGAEERRRERHLAEHARLQTGRAM